MKSLLLILFAITLCFSAYAANDSRTGVWTAELQDDGTLQMTIFHGQNENRRGAGSFRPAHCARGVLDVAEPGGEVLKPRCLFLTAFADFAARSKVCDWI